MSKFIVIEGADAVGKSTQLELLKKFFHKKKLKYKFFHFPRYDCPIYGEMISRFLKGDFGNAHEVNPYFVSLLYAGDRNDAKEIIRKWIKQGYFVLADRYFYSNVAFQSAKINNPEEKANFKHWIETLEYGYNRIPHPDLSIFLHVPFNFIINQLKNERKGIDREYLRGAKDIHENDLELQENVEREYLELVKVKKDFYLIECFSREKGILHPEEIHKRIVHLLIEKGVK